MELTYFSKNSQQQLGKLSLDSCARHVSFFFLLRPCRICLWNLTFMLVPSAPIDLHVAEAEANNASSANGGEGEKSADATVA